jgi:hypothetical protein
MIASTQNYRTNLPTKRQNRFCFLGVSKEVIIINYFRLNELRTSLTRVAMKQTVGADDFISLYLNFTSLSDGDIQT